MLVMCRGNGTVAASLGHDKYGSPSLKLDDDHAKLRAWLYVNCRVGAANLILADRGGQYRTVLGVDRDDKASLLLRDADGKAAWSAP